MSKDDMNEVEKIKERYDNRKKQTAPQKFVQFILDEREKKYSNIITRNFNDVGSIKFLEIGAGSGGNITFFKKIGIQANNIYANELLEERVEALITNHSDITVFPGNALDIDETIKYDVIFQSMVFTSILDYDFKKKLAQKMMNMLKPKGIIIWYDFAFDNPRNKDVKGVKLNEIKQLFLNGRIKEKYKVTLAPPIARRVGKMYVFFNAFPFLRTHIIAVIGKNI